MNVLTDPDRPGDDPVVQHAVKCLEAARAQGVFADAQAWLAGGAPVEPWDENDTPSRGHHFGSVLSALMCMTHLDAMRGDDSSRAQRFEIAFAMAAACATDQWLSCTAAGEWEAEAMQEVRYQLVAQPMSDGLLENLLALVKVDKYPSWGGLVEGELQYQERVGVRAKERFKSTGDYHAYVRERRVWSGEFAENPPATVAEPIPLELPKRLLRLNWSAGDGMDFWQSILHGLRRQALLRLLERRGTACLLAIDLFAVREGRLPKSLDEAADAAGLNKKMRIDPSAGEPYVYRIDPSAPHGYVLYSRGIDGVDNNGRFDLPHYATEALRKGGEGFDYNLLEPRFVPPPVNEQPVGVCGNGQPGWPN